MPNGPAGHAFWRSLTPDRQDAFLDLHVADQWLWLDDWRDRQAKTPELSDLKTVENDPLKTNDLSGGCELLKRFKNDSCESSSPLREAHVETLKSPISEVAPAPPADEHAVILGGPEGISAYQLFPRLTDENVLEWQRQADSEQAYRDELYRRFIAESTERKF